jgi:hypothetical protein
MLKDNGYVGAFIIFRQEVRPFDEKQIELVWRASVRRKTSLTKS